MKKIKKYFDDIFLGTKPENGIIALLIIGLISIFVLPALFTIKTNFFRSFDDTGPIGDTINGIAGPFIALTAALLTYAAFYMQFKANKFQITQFKVQKNQFDNQLRQQASTDAIARFENKYYELVRFHRANMEEMNIGDKVFARKCFVKMYSEYKFCFDLCNYYNIRFPEKDRMDEKELTKLAYQIFLFGIGENSEKQIKFGVKSDFQVFWLVEKALISIQEQYLSLETTNIKHPFETSIVLNEEDRFSFEAFYFPFDGHISRLAHYYRHLFHSVKFVVKQDESLISYERKLEYLQMLRAQLSNHEQVMLYYNAVSDFGEAWFVNEFFTKYKMIHNLPLALCDFGLKPHQDERIKKGIVFWREKGSTLFEQDE